MSDKRATRDIVVVGASAGGLDALGRLVEGLPADLPAAVFVVQHTQPGFASTLPEYLTRRGPLVATHALHGESIERGHIYVAPPDTQLMLRPGYTHVVRGPKENGHRPAVDALFRTAARSYGPRVVGVVLTGHLDCGTAGLLSIKARGGVCLVQDPKEAHAPGMPSSAVKHVDVDKVAPLAQLSSIVREYVTQPAGPHVAELPYSLLALEGDEPGLASELVCPACDGQMTVAEVNGFQSYRCHVGHSFSLARVALEQSDQVERALWAASRALEEASALSARCAATATGRLRETFVERQHTQFEQAQLIRDMLLHAEQKLPGPSTSAGK